RNVGPTLDRQASRLRAPTSHGRGKLAREPALPLQLLRRPLADRRGLVASLVLEPREHLSAPELRPLLRRVARDERSDACGCRNQDLLCEVGVPVGQHVLALAGDFLDVLGEVFSHLVSLLGCTSATRCIRRKTLETM